MQGFVCLSSVYLELANEQSLCMSIGSDVIWVEDLLHKLCRVAKCKLEREL